MSKPTNSKATEKVAVRKYARFRVIGNGVIDVLAKDIVDSSEGKRQLKAAKALFA